MIEQTKFNFSQEKLLNIISTNQKFENDQSINFLISFIHKIEFLIQLLSSSKILKISF
jgi:hypothetical protein